MNTKITNIVILLLVSIGALALLIISITRASLEIMRKDDKENILRTEPVIIGDKTIYKLPQSRVLPDNILYPLKGGRDWLWLRFSLERESKIRVALILADKKISEMMTLHQREKYDLAQKAGLAAIDYLIYAQKLTEGINKEEIIKKEMLAKIKEMAEVYSEIIEEMGKNDKIDEQKYFLLKQNINEFKERQS